MRQRPYERGSMLRLYKKISRKENRDVRHRTRGLHTKQDIKRGHTHEYPHPPFSVSKIVFCVLSFDSRYSADAHGQVANGHNV